MKIIKAVAATLEANTMFIHKNQLNSNCVWKLQN